MTAQKDKRRYLPTSDPEFVGTFLAEYYDDLTNEARRVCWKHQIRDFAEDAVSISLEKFMASRIEDRGPKSAIAFAMKIVKHTCIDEVRRRGRHAVLAGAMTGDLGDDDDNSSWVPEPAAASNPEGEVMAQFELLAVAVGFEQLPKAMAATHKNAARDLEIMKRRYLYSMSWDEIAADMDIDKAHRQSASRGRELLRGWVHALTGTQPEPDAANRKYWQRGFEAGEAYRESIDEWPPRGAIG